MSKYLLTGIGICGVCGASLSVRAKGRGQGRATYVCLTNLDRGGHCCTNSLKMDLADAEEAVRALFTDLLTPDMMRDVINGALARLRPSLDAQAERRAELNPDLSQLARQIENLVDAIADGDDAGRIREAIKDREHKAEQIRGQLADLAQLDQVAVLETAALTDELDETLAEWRGWIGGHPQQARQILQKLVVGRLTFTPKVEDGTAYYEFSGVGALEPILSGILPPRCSDSDRVKRWCPRGDSNTRHAV